MRENKFVFVVCGGKEHVDTLHFSLHTLRHFSKNEILVVTDTQRNEIAVKHDNIIDVITPEHLDHHQASIYLKTSLYRILPVGPLYCYLDTDVIALSNDVDDIFNHKTGVVTFAPDHSQMHQFSPYAVNCGCLAENRRDWHELDTILRKFDSASKVVGPNAIKKQQELKRKFELIKRNRLVYFQTALKYFLPGNTMRFDDDTYYNKASRAWYDSQGNVILHDLPQNAISQIENSTNWKWNRLRRRWISQAGKDVHDLHCQHLRENILKKFDVQIDNEKWQHWNGGVFLFDQGSRTFLHLWHLRTMKIFKDPAWKTRDQGTLIATVWQLGLQHSDLLSKQFNFIADPSNPRLMISDDEQYITDDAFETKYSPVFIHIFNQFGNKDWEVWEWITNKLAKENLTPKG
ncbi:MAG TPA: hypothetical protein VK174_02345 [Chitinophagales bacterium]|nr:hypothetical protein [Chitinophagales bacterium]